VNGSARQESRSQKPKKHPFCPLNAKPKYSPAQPAHAKFAFSCFFFIYLYGSETRDWERARELTERRLGCEALSHIAQGMVRHQGLLIIDKQYRQQVMLFTPIPTLTLRNRSR
jgi:hypothetical protein